MTSITADEIRIIAGALDIPPADLPDLPALDRAVGGPDASTAYLVLGVLTGRIPSEESILTFVREWRARDLTSVVGELSRRRWRRTAPIRVVTGVVADVTDTARTTFTTGIQRVARETLSRWSRYEQVELIVWDKARSTFVAASAAEASLASLGTVGPRERGVVIPFRSSFFLPEIAVDVPRATALRTVAQFSGSSTLAVGFDCIPVTTAETAGPGMPGAFSRYLSTLARFGTIAPISDAAGVEYSGWRHMLSGAGIAGPDIQVAALPTSIESASAGDHGATRSQLALGDAPVVLAVGSKEPRKNHLNLLHAAEVNWRHGHDFTLVLVGGNAWEARRVDTLISDLRRRGRRIITLSGVDDSVVWDLYGIARFTVFCSINEGFGLPVVESLSLGTPVLTSDFGSMRQLGENRGALLVDPHDPDAMASKMAELLTDDELVARLSALAVDAGAPSSTWDDYARSLHAHLTARTR